MSKPAPTKMAAREPARFEWRCRHSPVYNGVLSTLERPSSLGGRERDRVGESTPRNDGRTRGGRGSVGTWFRPTSSGGSSGGEGLSAQASAGYQLVCRSLSADARPAIALVLVLGFLAVQLQVGGLVAEGGRVPFTRHSDRCVEIMAQRGCGALTQVMGHQVQMFRGSMWADSAVGESPSTHMGSASHRISLGGRFTADGQCCTPRRTRPFTPYSTRPI